MERRRCAEGTQSRAGGVRGEGASGVSGAGCSRHRWSSRLCASSSGSGTGMGNAGTSSSEDVPGIGSGSSGGKSLGSDHSESPGSQRKERTQANMPANSSSVPGCIH